MTHRPSLVYLLLAILLLSGCQPGVNATTTDPATVAAFPGNHGDDGTPLLVDAAWLQRRVNPENNPPLILDVSTRRTYRQGHVPSAVHAYWQDTMDPYYPVYGVVLSDRNVAGARQNLLTQWGVGPETDVVVYGEDANRYAAHVVWFLRYLGHQRASLLDGGLAAWRGTGGEVATQNGSPPEPTTIITPTPQPDFVIGTRELSERLDDPAIVIVDIRPADELDDTLNESLPTGRIPGAVSLPWTGLTRDQDGRLRSPEELRQVLQSAGVTPDKDIVVYGFFGVETGTAWLALELLAYPSVRIYDQGWADWASNPELPIAPLPGTP